MVLNFQIEEVLDRLMKNEEAQKLTEAKKSELAKKFMLKWVDKKNTSGKKPHFEVPKVGHPTKLIVDSATSKFYYKFELKTRPFRHNLTLSTLKKVNKLNFIPGNTVCRVTKETVRKKCNNFLYDFSLV